MRTFDFQGLTIHTTPGYDNVTGLGVPNGLAFLALSLTISQPSARHPLGCRAEGCPERRP